MTRRFSYSTVTAASQIMLPTYVILFGMVGLILLLQDPARTGGDVFAVALRLLSAKAWGVVFLVVACVEGVALILGRTFTYMLGLILGAWLCAFWAVLMWRAASENPLLSYTSAVWVGGWVAAHLASTRSLARGER